MRLLLNLVALATALFSPAAKAAETTSVIRTVQGELRGVKESGAESFLGIPFAQPPIGQMRWRAPVPAMAWTGIRDATHAGSACYQAPGEPWGPYTSEFLVGPDISEDCLYLNVWRPVGLTEPAPVLVWIHGGGFVGGSGSIPIYKGESLARRGVIVVTINYRLGVFGFLASPELTAESGRQTSGNYGILDQIAALQWVRDNIAAFGGDPTKVTIAGQSAGAASVGDLMSSPLARGLFHRAIAQSGSGMNVDMPTLSKAEQIGQRMVAKAGVSSLADLRALPAAAILTAALLDPPKPGSLPPIYFAPNLDGVVIEGDPRNAASQIHSPVPLLTGFTADETNWQPVVVTSDAFRHAVTIRYGSFAERLLALYPHRSDVDASASMATLSRDRYMASLLLFSRARAANSNQPVFAYLFDYPYPGKASVRPPRAFHTSDVPYVFGTVDQSESPLTGADRAMENRMQAIWISFVRSGRPQLDGKSWPEVKPSSTAVMGLSSRPGMRAAVSTHERFEALRDYAASGGTLSMF